MQIIIVLFMAYQNGIENKTNVWKKYWQIKKIVYNITRLSKQTFIGGKNEYR